MIFTHGANSIRPGGGIPLPDGYHSVAAVYIPEYSNTQSKQFWTIPETDISGWSFYGQVYNPNVLNQGTNHIYLFQFGFGTSTYCAVRIYSKTMAHIGLPIARAANGSSYIDVDSEGGTAPLYPAIFDYSMKNGVAHIGPYTITGITQSEPNLITLISPFIWGGTSSTMTTDLATIYLKVYDADGVLRYDFVPAVREEDDYAGLYDLVNDVFYTNQYITSLTEIPE